MSEERRTSMINKIVRTSLFAVAVAALCSLAQASDFRSSTVTIPFPFQVSKKTLPAGEYRVEKNFDSEGAVLMNVQTRRSVQILLPNNSFNANGATKLTFVPRKNGYALRN